MCGPFPNSAFNSWLFNYVSQQYPAYCPEKQTHLRQLQSAGD